MPIVKITNGTCNVNGYPCVHNGSEVCDMCQVQHGNKSLPVRYETEK